VTTALDIRRPTWEEMIRPKPRPRLYRCCDPACTGYPKGHRHRETCDTTTRMPVGWRRGIVRTHLSRASDHLFLAEQLCQDPVLLVTIRAAQAVLRSRP